MLGNALVAKIRDRFPDIIGYGNPNERLPGVFAVSFPTSSIDLVVDNMNGLAIGKGSACSSMTVEPSHVLKQIKIEEDLLEKTVRISIGINATDKDINDGIDIIFNSLRLVDDAAKKNR